MHTKRNMRMISYDIAYAGIMAATMFVGQIALASIPNMEVVSLFVIVYTLCWGKKAFWPITIFAILQMLYYGFGSWSLYYLYIWHILSLQVYAFRKMKSVWFYSILSGFYGLSFGFLCLPVYFFLIVPSPAQVGLWQAIKTGLHTCMLWWMAGLYFDLAHGVFNFLVCLVLFIPVRKIVTQALSLSARSNS